MESKRLVRISQGKVIGGVCTGLGEYLNIDPILVRLFFLLLFFAEGIGVITYLLFWIFMPSDSYVGNGDLSDRVHQGAEEIASSARNLGESLRSGSAENTQLVTALGLGLVVIGVVYLINNLAWFSWIDTRLMFPLLMILGGSVMVYRYFKDQN